MKTLNFVKEQPNKWFIDLPQWEGTKAELAMVAGADTLLDTLNDNTDKVAVTVSEKDFEESNMKLKKLFNVSGGATYFVRSKKYTGPIWLCAVNKYVFEGHLPKRLFINY